MNASIFAGNKFNSIRIFTENEKNNNNGIGNWN